MNILVSACLVGCACRYDGKSKEYDGIKELSAHHTLIPFCPEIYGGLPTPRPPCEIKNGRVCTEAGDDVTEKYMCGAREALRIAKRYHCTAALLKENSPSCGHGKIYDGSFSRVLTDGNGITAALLEENGIIIYGENSLCDILS